MRNTFKNNALFIIFLFLKVSVCFSQADTFFRYKYSLDYHRDGQIKKQYRLSNGNCYLIEKTKMLGTQSEIDEGNGVLMLDNNKDVLWYKRFVTLNYYNSIKYSCLLKDQSVLLVGTLVSKTDRTDYAQKLVIQKVDKNGELKWSRTYQLMKSVNNTDEINYPVCTEANDGSILMAVTIAKNPYAIGSQMNFPAVFKFTPTGDIVWSRYFFKNERGTSSFPTGIIESENKIYLTVGAFRCEDSYFCQNAEVYFTTLSLNTQSGVLIKGQKSRLLNWPIKSGFPFNSEEGAVVLLNGNIKSASLLFATDYKNGKTLREDPIALTFEIDTSFAVTTGRQILFEGLKQKEIEADFSYSIAGLTYTESGDLLIGLCDPYYDKAKQNYQDTLKYYLAKLSSNYSFDWQKRISIASPKNKSEEVPSVFEVSNCNLQIALTHITKTNVLAPQKSFEIVNFNPHVKNLNNTCFGEDTAFLKIKEIQFLNMPFIATEQFTDILAPINVQFTSNNLIITKTEVCRFVNDCSRVKISGPDTACINEPVLIKIIKNGTCFLPANLKLPPAYFADTVWLNESELSLTFKKPWKGEIYISAGNCAPFSDSISLNILDKPTPVNLGKDTVLCNRESVVLKVGATYKSYKWSTGSVDNTINITVPGLYAIRVVDFCGYESTDTIMVVIDSNNLTLSNDTTICKGDTVQLSASDGFRSYLWRSLNELESPQSKTIKVSPSVTSFYSVLAEGFNRCIIEKQVKVSVLDCPESCFVPNSFTPNSDRLNDLFRPIITAGVKQYSFKVFNRFGQLIFFTSNPEKGWDGTFNSIPQTPGIYVWVLDYDLRNGRKESKRGIVSLFR